MCIESALLDCVKQQHVELLKQILLSYTYEIDPEQYNRLFNACFELADFIVIGEGEEPMLQIIKNLKTNSPSEDVIGVKTKNNFDRNDLR